MANAYVQIPVDDLGKKVDTSELTVGANTVERQRMNIADPTSDVGIASVTAANGLAVDVTRVAGNVAVTNAGLTNIDVALSTRTKPADQQHVLLDANSGVDIGKLTANQSVNNAQVSGTAISVNSGTKDAGTMRVILATDQPALTNKLLVTPDSVALPANQSVNNAQVSGTATSVNSGTKDAGTQRVILATDQPAFTTPIPVEPRSTTTPQTYSWTSGNFTPAATATDMCTLTGSGTKTIRVLRASICGLSTATAAQNVTLLKRNTANSAGTSTAGTIVPHDSNNAAATATPLVYTANPTAGNLVGNLRVTKWGSGAATVSTPDKPELIHAEYPCQGIVLRGTGEVLAINNAGQAIPAGGSWLCEFTWTEE